MWAQHNDVDAGRDIFKGVAGPLPLPVHQVVERKLAASENPQQLGLRHSRVFAELFFALLRRQTARRQTAVTDPKQF